MTLMLTMTSSSVMTGARVVRHDVRRCAASPSARVGFGVRALTLGKTRGGVSDAFRRRGEDATRGGTFSRRMRARTSVPVNATGGYSGGGFNIVPVPDRVVALAPYILPLLSALRYGRYFFAQFPAAIVLLKPLMPILRAVSSLPMGNLIMFFAIYLGIAKNQNLSRFCRFNAMQAILLDIALIFPSLVETLFGPGILGIGLPGPLVMVVHNAIFVIVLGAFALSAVGCMTGRYVRIPVISEAAEAQMGF